MLLTQHLAHQLSELLNGTSTQVPMILPQTLSTTHTPSKNHGFISPISRPLTYKANHFLFSFVQWPSLDITYLFMASIS